VASPLCVNTVYKEWVKSQTQLYSCVWLLPTLYTLFEFKTKHYCNVDTEIKFDWKYITKATVTKLLELIIDDTLSWKQHIDQVINKMCCLLCCTKYTIFSIIYLENNLFCSHIFCLKLWYNFGGKFLLH